MTLTGTGPSAAQFVLDASTVVSWALPDESDARAEQARLELNSGIAIVPHCWWFEVRNGLLSGERRGRTTAAANEHFLRELATLPIYARPHPDEQALFTLARRYRLSAYDAAYLELALRERCTLATLDGPLAAAAEAEGVRLAS